MLRKPPAGTRVKIMRKDAGFASAMDMYIGHSATVTNDMHLVFEDPGIAQIYNRGFVWNFTPFSYELWDGDTV